VLRVGAALVSMTLLAALIGPLATPYDPAHQDLALRLASPTVSARLGLCRLSGRTVRPEEVPLWSRLRRCSTCRHHCLGLVRTLHVLRLIQAKPRRRG